MAKVVTDKELKSYFEAMAAFSLPYDPAANNEVCSNNNKKFSASDAGIVPIVGGRDQ